MELFTETNITQSSIKGVYYSMFRLSQEYRDVIGKYAKIYVVYFSHFLIEIVDDENLKGSFKTTDYPGVKNSKYDDAIETLKNTQNLKEGGGRDSNSRTPTGVDLESTAFDLARQPPLSTG